MLFLLVTIASEFWLIHMADLEIDSLKAKADSSYMQGCYDSLIRVLCTGPLNIPMCYVQISAGCNKMTNTHKKEKVYDRD